MLSTWLFLTQLMIVLCQPPPLTEPAVGGLPVHRDIIEIKGGPLEGIVYSPELQAAMAEFGIAEGELLKMFEQQEITGKPITKTMVSPGGGEKVKCFVLTVYNWTEKQINYLIFLKYHFREDI